MPGPVHPSRPSHTSGNPPPVEPPKDKPVASQIPGVDTLYSAAETVQSTFSGFVRNVLNGAQLVVKTLAYVLFYPFFNHDSPEATRQEHDKSIEKIKNMDEPFTDRFREFVAKVLVGVRNRGDVQFAKEAIKAFAEVEKDHFEGVAKEVVESKKIDMTQVTLTPSAYVLAGLESGSITLAEFHHGLNMYRIKGVHSEEQLKILSYQVEMAEHNKGAIPTAKEIILLYAEKNPSGFKALAECLAELTEDVKASEGKTLETSAKEWVQSETKFSPATMREALDFMWVRNEIEAVNSFPLIQQLQQLADFLQPKAIAPKEKKSEVEEIFYRDISNARQVFISKRFIHLLNKMMPDLMQKVAMEMILDDEVAGNGLFKAASVDAKWKKKIGFDPVHYVLEWTKDEKKFESGRELVFSGLRRLESTVLQEGFSSGKLGSHRLHHFELASFRFGLSAFAGMITEFVSAKENEEIGPDFVQALIRVDGAGDGKSYIQKPDKDADLTKAVVEAATEASKTDDDSTVFIGNVRKAVGGVQSRQFQAEMEATELELSSKLESFLLLSELKIHADTPKFPREMLAAMAQSSEPKFTEMVLYIVEKFGAEAAVKQIDLAAKASPLHPEQVAKKRQEEHQARYALTRMLVSAPADLTEEEKTRGKEEAYRGVFLTHFGPDSTSFKQDDMRWLTEGMRAYLNK